MVYIAATLASTGHGGANYQLIGAMRFQSRPLVKLPSILSRFSRFSQTSTIISQFFCLYSGEGLSEANDGSFVSKTKSRKMQNHCETIIEYQ